jgi:hypothetical protein
MGAGHRKTQTGRIEQITSGGRDMDNVIKLLQEKNLHLNKFHELNESEINKFMDGQYEDLEVFYHARETILDMVRCIDRLIDSAMPPADEKVEMTPAQKKDVIQIMNEKNDLVTRILAQDLTILSCIEETKSSIIKELRQVQAAKKAVGGYKSGPGPSKLDEKA